VDFDEYQAFTRTTALFRSSTQSMAEEMVTEGDRERLSSLLNLLYTTTGLTGEAGEIANKVKKLIRDRSSAVSAEMADDLISELGDVLYYIAQMADLLGHSLEDVAQNNMDKLKDRVVKGTIGGSGDKR
jgi:NTP pyrophosphatase (non-canonical NTP hydrolase)